MDKLEPDHEYLPAENDASHLAVFHMKERHVIL